ncbi:hypothetical protein EDD85DRAFT_1021841 [Armillaria nabsnona]|nr:hypothetical protein EDD85DRAFT_1021841 [Armillaria nabsnona]
MSRRLSFITPLLTVRPMPKGAHKSHACTCPVQLFDHEPIVNAYRSIALPHTPAPLASNLNSLPSFTANRATGDATLAISPTLLSSTTSSDPNSVLFASATIPFHSNGVSHFSQSDAYAFVTHQQSDDASVVHDLAGALAVHHASEGFYDYQGRSTGINGAPYIGPYA